MPRLFSFLKPIRPYATRVLLVILIMGAFLLPIYAQAFNLPLTGGAAVGCSIGAGGGALAGPGAIIASPLGCLAGALVGGIAGWFAGDWIGGKVLGVFLAIINFIVTLIITIILPFVVRFLAFTIGLNTQPLTNFPPVLDATQVVRDFSNLVLIAVLIIIAMATIVGIESYGVRRALPLLIGIALIVNFSTVIVGVVIDSGNTVMRFFWESSGFNETPMDVYILRNMNLSETMAKGSQSEIANLIRVGGLAKTSAAIMKGLLYVMIILVTLLAIYIFLRLALVFLIRVSAIWIILITAPIIFITGALPFGKSRMREWWEELFNWAFLGPVVFFFLFFGIIIWTQINQFLGGHAVVTEASGTNIAYAAGPGGQNLRAFSLFFTLPIVVFFFQYALNASKKMAGSVANSLVDSAISIGKGVAFGGLALGAGAAVAGIGRNLLRRPGIKNMAQRLQRSRFKPMQNIGNRLGAAHANVIGQDARIAQGQSEAWEDTVAGMNQDQLERELVSPRRSRTQRQAIALAALEKNKPLSENAYKSALAIAGTDTKLEQQLKTNYLHYNPGMRNPDGTLDLKKIRDYAAKKDINTELMLDGANPDQTAELAATMSLVWDKGDMNRIAKGRPENLGKLKDVHDSLEDLKKWNPTAYEEFYTNMATRTGRTKEEIQESMEAQSSWLKTPHAQRAGGYRWPSGAPPSGGGAPPAP